MAELRSGVSIAFLEDVIYSNEFNGRNGAKGAVDAQQRSGRCGFVSCGCQCQQGPVGQPGQPDAKMPDPRHYVEAGFV